MQIAVLTFDGFNELDSFIAAAILNRVKAKGWKAHITVAVRRSDLDERHHRSAPAAAGVRARSGCGHHRQRRQDARDRRRCRSAVADQARSVPAADRRAMFRHADPGQAGLDRRSAGLHRPDDKALGHRSRRARAGRAVRRARQCGDRRRLPVFAISGGLDDRARRVDRGHAGRDPLCRAGRRKGRASGAGDGRGIAVPRARPRAARAG